MVDRSLAGSDSSLDDDPCSAVRRARRLISLFRDDDLGFADMRCLAAGEIPEPYAGLLAHNSHMTVAMERFHRGPVALRVVAERPSHESGGGAKYAREILLTNVAGQIVQYGIVCIDLSPLPPLSRQAILDKGEPLGRVLIASGMHRDVQEVELLQVTPGKSFGRLIEAESTTFGRVAEIRLDGRPAVELLEIVPSFAG